MSDQPFESKAPPVNLEKVCVLICNLGSPDAPTKKALRKYLKQFLSDKFVIDAPNRFLWLCILHLVILNIRPAKSAKKYQKIWGDSNNKAPLIGLCQELVRQLNQSNSSNNSFEYALAMRYGNPCIASALEDLKKKNCRKIVILPLYPQHSKTTTSSTFFEIEKITKQWQDSPEISYVNDYHDNAQYIDTLASSIVDFQKKNGFPDKLLISYHSIPQRYVDKGDQYYQHCLETTQLLVKKLKLDADSYEMCFQSIFGREKWLGPNISDILVDLASQGGHVQVVCPGFPVDCLETLEEIDMDNRQMFLDNGGANFHYIPALNASAANVSLISHLLSFHINS